MKQAAELAEDPGLKKYLELRSDALLTDEYQPSDMAWMDMKTNPLDVVIGPIETYEDQLFGYKTAHEAYVLVKDMEWSKKLENHKEPYGFPLGTCLRKKQKSPLIKIRLCLTYGLIDTFSLLLH